MNMPLIQIQKLGDERGSAVLDLIGFGVLLQVPLLILAFRLVSIQHDQLAAEAIARDSLRSYLIFDRPPAITAKVVAANYRIQPNRINLTINCNPVDCLMAGAMVRLSVQVGSVKANAVMQR